jgi:hypothetical protein
MKQADGQTDTTFLLQVDFRPMRNVQKTRKNDVVKVSGKIKTDNIR